MYMYVMLHREGKEEERGNIRREEEKGRKERGRRAKERRKEEQEKQRHTGRHKDTHTYRDIQTRVHSLSFSEP